MKHEGRGSFIAATVILVLALLAYVFMRQYTGFVLNYLRIENLNILIEIASVLVPFILWCVVNWALTTLMDGKGKMMEIYITGAYALTPLILVLIPVTVFSHYITIEEGTFYYLALGVGVAWAMALLVLGTGVIHEYGLIKTLFTAAATVVGIGIVLFIGLLFFDVVDRMLQFAQDLYIEISFRL